MLPQDSRCLQWDACYNVRDLGGLPIRSGGCTQYGAFIRSDNLSRLTEAGWNEVVRSGVRTVVDFRTLAERGIERCDFESLAPTMEVRFVHLPLVSDEQFAAAPHHESRVEGYLWMLEQAHAAVPTFIRLAAASEGALVFHCHSGKDRTGLMAALLLSLAGVDNADIAADYALSARYLASYQQWWLKNGPGTQEERDREATRFGTEPALIRGVLEALHARYGGIAEYLRATGVDQIDIDAATAKLRVPK